MSDSESEMSWLPAAGVRMGLLERETAEPPSSTSEKTRSARESEYPEPNSEFKRAVVLRFSGIAMALIFLTFLSPPLRFYAGDSQAFPQGFPLARLTWHSIDIEVPDEYVSIGTFGYCTTKGCTPFFLASSAWMIVAWSCFALANVDAVITLQRVRQFVENGKDVGRMLAVLQVLGAGLFAYTSPLKLSFTNAAINTEHTAFGYRSEVVSERGFATYVLYTASALMLAAGLHVNHSSRTRSILGAVFAAAATACAAMHPLTAIVLVVVAGQWAWLARKHHVKCASQDNIAV